MKRAFGGAFSLWMLAACQFLPASAAVEPQVFHAPNGMRCLLLEKHDQPLVRCELTVGWSPSEEPAGHRGLAGLLAATMRAGGAGPYSRPEFSRALDDLGVVFTFASRRNAFRWTLVADSRSQEPALELLAHAVFRPAFDTALVDAQRAAYLETEPTVSTWTQTEARFLWGLGDAATERPPSGAWARSVTRDELEAFRRRVLRPEAATLVLHGDLNLAQAKELVFLHFGLWSPGGQGPLAAGGPEPAPQPRLDVALEGTADAECWAGREATQVAPAVRELLSVLLEQDGVLQAPGVLVSSSLEPGRPLLVKAKADATGRNRLVKALGDTLERLRSRGFTQADLERARLRWNARRSALPLHPGELVGRLQDGTLEADFLRQVEGVRVQELNKALADLLSPATLRVLLLGADDRLIDQAKQANLIRP